MSLRIVKSSEPLTVERLNMCLYAPPGVGKTTLAFTADDPLLLDFDKGAHRAGNRKDIVSVGCWQDAAEITAEDLAPYRTVITDTAGRALDFLAADIISHNPKMGRGGALTLQGFGELKARFSAWLKMLNTFGKDVILIAHMDEQRSGDDILERLDVQGGSKGEIYKSVDAMGRIFVTETQEGQKKRIQRVLDFSPRPNSFGKNPANLEPLNIPDVAADPHFLGKLIADIKAKMNELSEEQKEAQSATEQWLEAIETYSTADDFNGHLAEIKKAPKAAQSAFNAKAKSLGLKFNKPAGKYESEVKPPEAKPAEQPASEELFAGA